MSDPRLIPTNIVADNAAQELRITWGDGHTSVYSFEGLRRACPCAECRGGHGQPPEPVDPEVWDLPGLMDHELREVRPMGNYALQLVWGDGHSAGIWSWAYLRSLRPPAGETK